MLNASNFSKFISASAFAGIIFASGTNEPPHSDASSSPFVVAFVSNGSVVSAVTNGSDGEALLEDVQQAAQDRFAQAGREERAVDTFFRRQGVAIQNSFSDILETRHEEPLPAGNVVLGADGLREDATIGFLRTSSNPDDRRLSSNRWVVATEFAEISVTNSAGETVTERYLNLFHVGTGFSILVNNSIR